MAKRFAAHLADCSKTNKARWIRELLNEGVHPRIEWVEEGSAIDLNGREVFWIEHFKLIGANLTNGTSGGDGGRIQLDEKSRQDWIAKLSRRKKEWWSRANEAARLKHSRALTAHWDSLTKDERRLRSAAISRELTGRPSIHKGLKRSEDFNRKVRNSLANAETRRKMSAARKDWWSKNKNRPRPPISDQTREKLRESARKREARKRKVPPTGFEPA